MCQAFAGSVARDRFAARLKNLGDRLLAEARLLLDLGLAPPMDDLFCRIAEFAGEGGRITPYEIDEGVLMSVGATAHVTGQQVADFGVLMGLLAPEPLRTGDSEDLRPYALNALAAAALRAAAPMEAA